MISPRRAAKRDVGEALARSGRRRPAPAASPSPSARLGGNVESSCRPTIRASSSSSVIVVDPRGAAQLAVAQHRDPVGELADLGEAVGDVDDRGARRRRLAHPVEEQVDGVAAERGGGLVEDEQRGLDGERLGELEQVLLRHASATRPGPRGARSSRRRRASAASRRTCSVAGAARNARRARRPGCSPATVMSGSTAGCWWTIAMPELRSPPPGSARRPARRRTVIVPPSGAVVPDATPISVDLPAPFSPRSACTSPGRMSSETSVSAATPA